MKVIRPTDPDYASATTALNRRAEASDAVREVVAGVIKAVRERGDAAVLELTEKFDGAKLTAAQMRVPQAELDTAWNAADDTLRSALEASHRNVMAFAKRSMRQAWSYKNEQGAEVGEVFHPFERVGCYVPGGTAPLVSTSIMTVTFAAAAGVPEIVVCTPCGRDGSVNPGLLAALKLAGATEVIKSAVRRPSPRSPSARRRFALSQRSSAPATATSSKPSARHSALFPSTCCPAPAKCSFSPTNPAIPPSSPPTSSRRPSTARTAWPGSSPMTPRCSTPLSPRSIRSRKTLSRQAQLAPVLEKGVFCMLVPSLEEGARLVNDFAPEHLTLITTREDAILPLIRTAGAIFLGNHSPVAVGDFLAGPSHTLPTGGSGKSFPGITADMFQRRTSIIRLDRESCVKSEPIVRAFSQVEGLDAHGRSVSIRCS
jgi:histidinol dehydrogenase